MGKSRIKELADDSPDRSGTATLVSKQSEERVAALRKKGEGTAYSRIQMFQFAKLSMLLKK